MRSCHKISIILAVTQELDDLFFFSSSANLFAKNLSVKNLTVAVVPALRESDLWKGVFLFLRSQQGINPYLSDYLHSSQRNFSDGK